MAATLPGGEYLHPLLAEASDGPHTAILPEPVPDLAASALEALIFVAGPGGPWHQGWTSETYRIEARQTAADLAVVLRLNGGREDHLHWPPAVPLRSS
ncbi:hypothetical protein [Dactylosporangium fulvum]|uniref:Uncharacterized protein n=1 Tax=Dactylosporangium fulvum TaxID=53359 RepID=A0ABY5VYP9_9ACTN|nr:hypothetical protein [Dactylosporangium fulvum]UWP82780.1 hypothetical protein Dfulv_00160 [Dactylosporangium fulvum]